MPTIFFLFLAFTPPCGCECCSKYQTLCLNSPLAHVIGHCACMNRFSLASLHLSSTGAPGLYEEYRCWWTWSGSCAKCLLQVKGMEGIFCANFCEPRGSWPACRKAWHAECYACLGQGKFPVMKIQDEEGNMWYKHERRVKRINHGVRGAHTSISFQCESCWIVNLEDRPPAEGLDDVFMMMICRANLDAMGGRAVATIEAHAAAINKAVLNCQLLRKMPSIPPRGPMPLADMVGMSLAVELLFHSLTAVPRIKGQSHIQFDSIRKQ